MVLISPTFHIRLSAKSEAGPAGNGLTKRPAREFSASIEAAKVKKRKVKFMRGRNEYMMCNIGQIGFPSECEFT